MPDHPLSNTSDFRVWAVRYSGDDAELRGAFDAKGPAIDLAIWIARKSGPEGAVSVYVIAPDGGLPYAAGHMAAALREAGAKLDGSGHEIEPAAAVVGYPDTGMVVF